MVGELVALLLEGGRTLFVVERGLELAVVGVEGLEVGEGLQESAAVGRVGLPETTEEGEGISCRRELFESEGTTVGEGKIREASDGTGVEGSLALS